MGTANHCYDRYWKGPYSWYELDKWTDDLSPIPFQSRVTLSKVKQAGYSDAKFSDGHQELTRLLWRIDCGLLCYDRCTIKELERFVRDRKLAIAQSSGAKGKAKKIQLVKALMCADEDVWFPRLLDLPVELRNRIYELSMADYPQTLHSPTKPPLSRVCKQL